VRIDCQAHPDPGRQPARGSAAAPVRPDQSGSRECPPLRTAVGLRDAWQPRFRHAIGRSASDRPTARDTPPHERNTLPITALPDDHRDLPMHDGRPRLLGLLDREDCLGRVMTPGVIYSLADRPCSSCKSGNRPNPGVTVALVNMPVDDPVRPYRLHALCAEHAELWESR
jgi:hypothetical protein